MRSIIVASLLALSGSAAAVQPGIYQTRGTSAYGYGGSWDETGCDDSGTLCCYGGDSTSAEGYESLVRTNDGRTETNVGYLSTYSYRECIDYNAWTWTYEYTGFSAYLPGGFSVSRLNSATIQGTDVQATTVSWDGEVYSEATTLVDVLFTFTGVGTTSKGFYNAVSRDNWGFSHSRSSGSYREATLAGSIDGVPMDLGAYTSGSISTSASGSVARFGGHQH